ncbi:MAG: fumarylacetoacetate hydrolase family protein [bacterium]|jgi:2-keto-4-pentenoate hydratase/2-oxohepta-3-ene-1,7-dioic acid hydratase in catechol pathway|nr:fumarylacetoacetate hydrolase family protein [bacterium]
MKLVRFGEINKELPGVLMEDGSVIDVSSCIPDFNRECLETGGLERLRAWLPEYKDLVPRIPESVRLGSPIADPSKIICVGLNFLDHCKELNDPIPNEPVLFTKAVSALSGPFDPIENPRGASHLDWEVELAFIVGKEAKNIAEENALEYVAGYALMNDLSERFFQKHRDGQWVKGKSHDTFAPLGPYIATPEELPDVYNLSMVTKVNGEILQNGNTSSMIFKVPFLLSYISQFMTLKPGDIISTGTPPGVGAGKKPPRYLQPGDQIEQTIPGLGTQRHTVIACL